MTELISAYLTTHAPGHSLEQHPLSMKEVFVHFITTVGDSDV